MQGVHVVLSIRILIPLGSFLFLFRQRKGTGELERLQGFSMLHELDHCLSIFAGSRNARKADCICLYRLCKILLSKGAGISEWCNIVENYIQRGCSFISPKGSRVKKVQTF